MNIHHERFAVPGKGPKKLVHKSITNNVSIEHKNHDQCIGADQTGARYVVGL